MATTAVRFGNAMLPPLYPRDAVVRPVNLAPGTTFLAGQLLGQITTAANDVQTVTLGASNTGGTFTLTASTQYGSGTTTALAFNAAAAAVQAALVAIVGTGNVTATGSAGGPYTVTFVGNLAAQPVAAMTGAGALTGGTNTVTIVHTTTGRTADTYANYNDSLSDGTQTAKCINVYTCTTDAGGNVYFGTAAGAFWGETQKHGMAYSSGYFDTRLLVGLDANGVADLGKLTAGTTAAGILCVTGS